jgi:hypothetical protein
MAGDWIKMQKSLPRDPRVVRISSALKADRLRTVGGLFSAWCLFDEQTEDGKLEGYTPEILDDLIGFPGLAKAMQSVGWLDIDGDSLRVPRFEEHNGQSAKRRAQDVVRKTSARKADKCPQDEKTFVHEKSALEKRREDESNKRMAKPSVDEISEYGKTLDPPFRKAEAFVAFYESNGWKVGKNPMKDWKAAIRTWQQKDKTTTPTKPRPIHEEFSYQKNGKSEHRPLWD